VERIDFYILPGAGRRAAELFACRLAEKAFAQGHRIFVRTEDRHQAEVLDELLWTFRAGSFVPHALLGADDEAPVQLGDALPARAADLLINLGGALPEGWEAYDRLAEVVDQRPEVVTEARRRFRRYRKLGYPPHYHKLDKEPA